MYPSKQLKKVAAAIEKTADDWEYGITPLSHLSTDDTYCFQPYDKHSDVGPERKNVRQFLHEVLWKRLPVKVRKGLSLAIKSYDRSDDQDIYYCDPVFPLEPKIYYIEVRVQ